MEDAVTCAVCHEVYQTGSKDPLVLPCGHTLCRCCLNTVKSSCLEKPFACPLCRSFHPFVSIHSLPVNFSLLSLATSFQEEKNGFCGEHGGPSAFWCRECQKGVCGLCLLSGHLREGHEVIPEVVAVAEKRSRFNDDASSALQNIKEIQRRAASHFEGFLAKAMLLSAAGDVFSDMGRTVAALQEAASRAKGVGEVLGLEADLNDKVLAKRMSKLLRVTNLEPGVRTDNVAATHLDGSSSVPLSSEESASSRSNSTSEDEMFEVLSRSASPSECQMTPLLPLSARKEVFSGEQCALSCKVHVGDGRHGQLAWEDDQLVLYALAPAAGPDPQVLIKFSAIEDLLDRERPTVFLDLSAGERLLGRVYIRLRGALRRAQQFLALCVGVLGPSFAGAPFARVNDRGQEGESLVGGKYFCPRAKRFVARGVLSDLEWGDHHGDVDKAGYVADYSGGLAKLDTLFGICTRDNPEMDLVIPVFGEVAAGLEVVAEAAKYDPVSDVVIARSGMVVPMRPQKDTLSSIIDALSIN